MPCFVAQSFAFVAQSFGGKSQSSRPTLLPPLQPWFVKETAFFSAKAQKLKNSAFAEFWDSMPVFYGGILYWLLEKQGKLYFLQSSQTKGRDVLAAFATLVCQRNCVFLCKGTKAPEFGIRRILGLYAGFRLGMRFCL